MTYQTPSMEEERMISFDAEVLEVKVKKDGLDRMYKIVLETNQPECLKLQNFIAKDTVRIEVKDMPDSVR